MKIAVCCIVKDENQYILEYVEYYKKMGFDNIIICDNNDDNSLEFILKQYIKDNFVILKNYRNLRNQQLQAYNDVYNEYKNEYDWIAFFDIDEFIELNPEYYTDIKTYLAEPMFDNASAISIHWKCYGDNNLVYNDYTPVVTRFTKPLKLTASYIACDESGTIVMVNSIVKSIIRGGLNNDIWKSGSQHAPYYIDNPLFKSNTGQFIKTISTCQEIDDDIYKYCYLKHYITKSTEEYVHKLKRGYPDDWDYNREDKKSEIGHYIKNLLKTYFALNTISADKINYLQKFICDNI